MTCCLRLVQCHAGYGEDGGDNHCSNNITNSLAAFLIGARENSFYGCSKSWNVGTDPVDGTCVWYLSICTCNCAFRAIVHFDHLCISNIWNYWGLVFGIFCPVDELLAFSFVLIGFAFGFWLHFHVGAVPRLSNNSHEEYVHLQLHWLCDACDACVGVDIHSTPFVVCTYLVVWHPEYDKPLGAPTSDATKNGNVWTRSFASGTVVTFDVSSNEGTIKWAN